VADGVGGRLRPVGHLELPLEVAEVALDGLDRHEQTLTDLAVAAAVREQPEDVGGARAEAEELLPVDAGFLLPEDADVLTAAAAGSPPVA
jgi:hypothetical protein